MARSIKASFSLILDDPEHGPPLIEVLSALGLGELNHFPLDVLTSVAAISQRAKELFPGESSDWIRRAEAVAAMQELGCQLSAQGRPIHAIVAKRRIGGNPYAGLFEQFPLAACVAQDFDSQTRERILPYQALLLRTAIHPEPERDGQLLSRFANLLRLARTRAHSVNRLLEALSELTGKTPDEPSADHQYYWSKLKNHLPHLRHEFKAHRDAIDFLRIVDALVVDIDPPPARTPLPFKPVAPSKPSQFEALRPRPAEPVDDVLTRTPGKSVVSRPRATRIWALPEPDQDPRSPDPDETLIGQTTASPADAPNASPERERLELRYSNYNTAIDNQLLPHTWDSLSVVEIACLAHHLRNDLASDQNRVRAFWTGLLLITGQTIEIAHRMITREMVLVDDFLDRNGTWRRFVRLPAEAFTPDVEQTPFLVTTAESFELILPEPLRGAASNAIQALELSGNQTPALIEASVRSYCEHLRATTGLRFLPGRIASVLKPKVMGHTGDAVTAHLIAGRPTDVPPMGVFYSSYPVGLLARVYQDVTASLLGKSA